MEINDKFYDLTAEKIAQRVLNNKAAYQLKFEKKNSSEQEYQKDKVFVGEK